MFTSLAYTQTGSNPFEIKFRLGKEDKTIIKVNTQSFSNPDSIAGSSGVGGVVAKAISSPNDSTSKIKNTVLNPFDVDHIPLKKSLLKTNKENLNKQLETTKNSNSFLFWFLLIAAALLAIALNIRLQIISLITKSIFNENLLKLFHREESGKNSLGLGLLYIIFALNGGAFIYLLLKHFGGPQGILIYLSLIGLIAVFFLLKHLGLWLIGDIFIVQKQTSLYSFAIMNNNLFLGIILLPINLIIAFGPTLLGIYFIYITIGVVLLLLSFQYIRGLFIVSEYLIDGLFQIIVYLCAFELIPVIVLVKTLFIS